MSELASALAVLEKTVPNPSQGLPDLIFYYISRTTPLVNVDLLVQDPTRGTLLSWRDDTYSGRGWHVPGGIIRHQEKIEDRIRHVARLELRAEVSFDPAPLAINEIITREQRDRSHFISLLYRCRLKAGCEDVDQLLQPGMPGYLQWHTEPPANMISWHEIYRGYLERICIEV